MKIRVTLIIFMCTTFAANADKFPETKDLAKKSEPRHRVYEYSRSIEAVSVDFGNANGGGRSEVTKHVRLSYTPDEEDISDSMVGNHIQKGSERSLQVLTSTRKNSKQPSKILHSDGSTSSEKGFSCSCVEEEKGQDGGFHDATLSGLQNEICCIDTNTNGWDVTAGLNNSFGWILLFTVRRRARTQNRLNMLSKEG
ncbi:uncharacterized protein LOC124293398 isoform X1 [Neodiprion lecontei]|uniref:Uncharacterized protein LOC124293398 isoform X1 n=1 Tax=Neodiprion lecontei TaxID=441921 RepID=A0ABM3FQC1_NEOLC|nr:uncharacterized protein LOC124293398 isoform X1 [Neodiprion lecontei]